MNKKDFDKRLRELKRTHLLEIVNLCEEYSMDNRAAKIGDIVIGNCHRIKVEKVVVINVSTCSCYPSEKYIGTQLTKKNEVAKKQVYTSLYSNNVIEVIKQ